MLAYDPNINPTTPNNIIAISFHSTQLYFPSLCGQNVIISINGGNINASVDELIAPTNEIIGPKFGTIAAKITVKLNHLFSK